MKLSLSAGRMLSLFLGVHTVASVDCFATEANPQPPAITGANVVSNTQRRISWTPYPAAQQFRILSTTNLAQPYTPDSSGVVSGYDWTAPLSGQAVFHRVEVVPLSSNALLNATILNRLTYGPTPSEIERITAIGPQAYINEQLAGETIVESLDTAPPITNSPPRLTNWTRVTLTGTTTGTNLYIYLSGPGRVYVDFFKMVKGTNINVGVNMLKNPDFEALPLTTMWRVPSLYSTSVITNSPTVNKRSASGARCLLLVGTSGGSGSTSSSIWQGFSPTNHSATQRFALAFSYLPTPNSGSNVLTVRLSGGQVITNIVLPPAPPVPPPALSPLYGKLTNGAPPLSVGLTAKVTNTISDLRAYHVMRAVQSKRQLHEILVQFFDNHFCTEYQKIEDWFDNNQSNVITNDSTRANLAVDLKWREYSKWRKLLLDPRCNFYDLLKASAESPAMIIYLDTILSSRSAANENYARELLELHTFGADNGYIQQDIVDLAKIWTGWRVDKKATTSATNALASPVANRTNNVGVWVLHFSTNSHNYTSTKRLFTNNVIDPRFGPPYGGQPYSLIISNNAYPGTNGMQEGYRVIQHLANLPYTAEFLSVKLCRLFIHEHFEFGVYDYTDPNLSPEAQLVKDCMTAWDTPASDGRKGNIRSVLTVIFNSALFRGHGASQQKIKTPLEFTISAIRALRLGNTDSSGYVTASADTDGYGLSGASGNTSPLGRMGGMGLFNKAEPDGYSEFGRIWLNTANLCERMRFAQHLMMPSTSSLKSSDYGSPGTRNSSDPAKLVRLKLAQPSWNDPAAIADYFLSILFPGEGKANLDLDRQAAINFLSTDDAGNPSPFNLTSHDGRLRGMVALLLCLPRFQEQ